MFGGPGGEGGGPGGAGGPTPFNMFFGPGGPAHGAGHGPGEAQGFMNPLEMLFGAGGFAGPMGPMGGSGGAVDPTLLENLFGPGAAAGMAAGGFHPANFGAAPPFAGGGAGNAAAGGLGNQSNPPTSKSMMRQLPRVKVTPHDLAANESNECSICLDELVIGQPALRIPCGHLYHEDCVQDWLKKSNECPVCRYELPTDDLEFEQGRKRRMAGRKLRMRRADLTVKTAQELRKLADFIGVDVKGCLEKVEFVDRIAAHPKVEIIPEAGGEAASMDSSGAFRQPAESVADTPMRAHSSSTSPPCGFAPQAAAAASHSSPTNASSAPGSPSAVVPLRGRSIAQLRQLAKQLGVSLDGCLEKGDIVQRIREAPGYREAES